MKHIKTSSFASFIKQMYQDFYSDYYSRLLFRDFLKYSRKEFSRFSNCYTNVFAIILYYEIWIRYLDIRCKNDESMKNYVLTKRLMIHLFQIWKKKKDFLEC